MYQQDAYKTIEQYVNAILDDGDKCTIENSDRSSSGFVLSMRDFVIDYCFHIIFSEIISEL